MTRKVVEPLGEAMPNHYVISELAKRLGAKHRGFAMSEWEIIDETLKISGHKRRRNSMTRAGKIAPSISRPGISSMASVMPIEKFRFRPDWSAIGGDVEGLPVPAGLCAR